MGNFSPTLAGAAMAGGSQTHSYCLLALASSARHRDPDEWRPVRRSEQLQLNVEYRSDVPRTQPQRHLWRRAQDQRWVRHYPSSNVAVVADPYSGLATNIPSNTCGGSYPQEPTRRRDTPLPASNQWSGAKTLPATTIGCGDLQLTGITTLTTASPGSVSSSRMASSIQTAIRSKQPGLGADHRLFRYCGKLHPCPDRRRDIGFSGANIGHLGGIAIYQDPALTTGLISPRRGIRRRGTSRASSICLMPASHSAAAVNKSSNGTSCFELVSDNITITARAVF